MPNNTSYRKDIDGLRAIAVMLVVLFHAKINGFSGGFIGVDIFFVISGYLITSIILKEIKEQRFSFTSFYERRVRRIFPALFFMLAITLILAAALLMPLEFKNFGKSLTATSLFFSNIIFWRGAGYFDSAAILKPLLHTWSVTIEEQFYILFPLYLFLSYKYLRKFFIPLTIAGLFASLLLSVWTLSISKDTATFYLLPTRAWEFLVGSVLAFNIFPKIKNSIASNLIAISGIALIFVANAFMNEGTTFPGINALYPTVGAFLIIYAGMNGLNNNITSKLLSITPMRFIGKISYSLYLWHWPVFVFASYYAMRDFSLLENLLLIGLCFILAFFSWKYVEQPFRSKGVSYNRKKLFTGSIITILLFAALGYYIQKSNGVPWRFNETIQNLSSVQKGPSNPRYFKHEEFPWVAKWIGQGTDNPSFLVIGDSHANAVSPALDKLAKELGKTGLLLKQPGCMPALNIKDSDLSVECAQFNRDVKQTIKQFPNISKIYLIARWSVYPKWLSKTRNPQGTEQSRQHFSELLNGTIGFYADKNIDTVIVTEAPRVKGVLVPSILGRHAYYHSDILDIRPLQNQHITDKEHITSILADITSDIEIIDLYKHLCSSDKCDVIHDGKSLYYDDDHLSTYGAETISSAFKGSLEK